MASFFNELGEKISRTGQSAVKKTMDMAETAKLNTMISEEESRVHQYLYEIGKVYYENKANNPEEMFLEKIEQVKMSLGKIEELKQKVNDIKGGGIPQTGSFCPSCGSAVKPGMAFCQGCGTKLN